MINLYLIMVKNIYNFFYRFFYKKIPFYYLSITGGLTEGGTGGSGGEKELSISESYNDSTLENLLNSLEPIDFSDETQNQDLFVDEVITNHLIISQINELPPVIFPQSDTSYQNLIESAHLQQFLIESQSSVSPVSPLETQVPPLETQVPPLETQVHLEIQVSNLYIPPSLNSNEERKLEKKDPQKNDNDIFNFPEDTTTSEIPAPRRKPRSNAEVIDSTEKSNSKLSTMKEDNIIKQQELSMDVEAKKEELLASQENVDLALDNVQEQINIMGQSLQNSSFSNILGGLGRLWTLSVGSIGFFFTVIFAGTFLLGTMATTFMLVNYIRGGSNSSSRSVTRDIISGNNNTIVNLSLFNLNLSELFRNLSNSLNNLFSRTNNSVPNSPLIVSPGTLVYRVPRQYFFGFDICYLKYLWRRFGLNGLLYNLLNGWNNGK